jgi:hypothetical protein
VVQNSPIAGHRKGIPRISATHPSLSPWQKSSALQVRGNHSENATRSNSTRGLSFTTGGAKDGNSENCCPQFNRNYRSHRHTVVMNSENVALPNAGGVLGRVRRFQWITRLPSGRERTVCDTPNGVVFRTMDSAVDAERRENSAGPVVAALPNPPCGVGHDWTLADTMFLRAVAASNAQEGMMRVMLAGTRKDRCCFDEGVGRS